MKGIIRVSTRMRFQESIFFSQLSALFNFQFRPPPSWASRLKNNSSTKTKSWLSNSLERRWLLEKFCVGSRYQKKSESSAADGQAGKLPTYFAIFYPAKWRNSEITQKFRKLFLLFGSEQGGQTFGSCPDIFKQRNLAYYSVMLQKAYNWFPCEWFLCDIYKMRLLLTRKIKNLSIYQSDKNGY